MAGSTTGNSRPKRARQFRSGQFAGEMQRFDDQLHDQIQRQSRFGKCDRRRRMKQRFLGASTSST